jgi:hypothetical protein
MLHEIIISREDTFNNEGPCLEATPWKKGVWLCQFYFVN